LDGAIELEDIENSDSFIYTNITDSESKLETDDEGALSYRRLEREIVYFKYIPHLFASSKWTK